MYLKLIAIVMGGLFLSTSLIAVEPQHKPAPMLHQKPSQDKLTKEREKIYQYNTIFDDPTSGGLPYEHKK